MPKSKPDLKHPLQWYRDNPVRVFADYKHAIPEALSKLLLDDDGRKLCRKCKLWKKDQSGAGKDKRLCRDCVLRRTKARACERNKRRSLDEYQSTPSLIYRDYKHRIPQHLKPMLEDRGRRLCRSCLELISMACFGSGKSVCASCAKAVKRSWDSSNRDRVLEIRRRTNKRKAKRARVGRSLEMIGMDEAKALDVARRFLSQGHPPLDSETEHLAYLRGFMAGRAEHDEAGNAIREYEDLVFRIASDNARKFYGPAALSYEDCVSIGYQAVLAIAARRKTPDRPLVAKAIRGAIIDAARSKLGKDGQRLALYKATDPHDSDGEGMIETIAHTAPDQPCEVEDILSKLEGLDERSLKMCRMLASGLSVREVSEALELSESRTYQLVYKIRRNHGEQLERLLAEAAVARN